MRMLPFLIPLTEKGDFWGQFVFFLNERLNNSQFKGFGDIS